MGKLSEFMEGFNMIDDAKSMEEELLHNKMVKRFEKHTWVCNTLHSTHRACVWSIYRRNTCV